MQAGKTPSEDVTPDNPVALGLNKLLGSWFSDVALYQITIALGLIVLLVLIYLVCRFLIFRPIARSKFASKRVGISHLFKSKVLASLAAIVAILVVDILLDVIPKLQPNFLDVTHRVVAALLILAVAQLIVRSGRLADVIYSNTPAVNRERALRGYVTVGSVLIYIVAIVLVISAMLEKSPIYFLTGLGAMSVFLVIIFRDTLLSMFANVIVTTGDLVRVGDWIAVEKSDANGFVIDVSLNVVKVQNFDKTITCLPTYILVQNSFINYRGMYDSGGRRIKRSIMLDQLSVRNLSEDELSELKKIPLMEKALKLECQAVAMSPEKVHSDGLLIPNSGLFRQYVSVYLQEHPKIRQDMTLLVQQLQATESGLPIQAYCFVNDTRWMYFENIQATIFDHLISMVPVFGLRVFQAKSVFIEPGPEARRVELAPEALKMSGISAPALSDESKP